MEELKQTRMQKGRKDSKLMGGSSIKDDADGIWGPSG